VQLGALVRKAHGPAEEGREQGRQQRINKYLVEILVRTMYIFCYRLNNVYLQKCQDVSVATEAVSVGLRSLRSAPGVEAAYAPCPHS
jgi:hypothetical protein